MNSFARIVFVAALSCATPALAGMQVDVNSADARTLAQALDGVGLVKAEAIVAYRNAHGPFRSLDDLGKVDGIGRHVIEQNRESIVFGKAGADAQGGTPHPLATW